MSAWPAGKQVHAELELTLCPDQVASARLWSQLGATGQPVDECPAGTRRTGTTCRADVRKAALLEKHSAQVHVKRKGEKKTQNTF